MRYVSGLSFRREKLPVEGVSGLIYVDFEYQVAWLCL